MKANLTNEETLAELEKGHKRRRKYSNPTPWSSLARESARKR